tara:strand:- start:2581 stop:2808 length:228 start_codon:yes stop_codon:yes gene_type:complete
MQNKDDFLLEKISELIHEEWMEWAKQIEHEVSEERRQRWNTVYCKYDELSEEMKDKDRDYGRKVLAMLKEFDVID